MGNCLNRGTNDAEEDDTDPSENTARHSDLLTPNRRTSFFLGGLKEADARDFVSPCKAIGVSGGSAGFFVVKYANPPEGVSESYWIGKDLSRAQDEVTFYETAETCKQTDPGTWAALQFMFDYGGVLTTDCIVGTQPPTSRKLVLIRNLYDGVSCFRMMDIKIGAVTAVGGWQGKSHIRAWRQRQMVDQHTNSATEGYRLEGFEGVPASLESVLKMESKRKPFGAGKRARRLTLQRLQGSEMFAFFGQVRAEEPTPERLSGSEVAAAALKTTVRQLLSLLGGLAAVPVPQQWIGSSVSISFDAAEKPRQAPLHSVNESTELLAPDAEPFLHIPEALVHIFDWGRSELCTPEAFEGFPKQEQRDRRKHWEEYKDGVLRLAFEATRAYKTRYCPARSRWKRVRLSCYDYDQMQDPEMIGTCDLALKPCPPEDHDLLDKDAQRVVGKGGRATRIRVSIEGPQPFPQPSMLAERWVVKVVSVRQLPKMDVVGWCDPFVTITLFDSEGTEGPTQQSCVMDNTESAHFMESFEFCTASAAGRSADDVTPEHLRGKVEADLGDWDLPNPAAAPFEVKRLLDEFRALFLQQDRQLVALQNAVDEGALPQDLFDMAVDRLRTARGGAPTSSRAASLQYQRHKAASFRLDRTAQSTDRGLKNTRSQSLERRDDTDADAVVDALHTIGDLAEHLPDAGRIAAALREEAPRIAPLPAAAAAAGVERWTATLRKPDEPLGLHFTVLQREDDGPSGEPIVVLQGAAPGSAADRAGLSAPQLSGRLIVAVGGTPVRNGDAMTAAIGSCRANGNTDIAVDLGPHVEGVDSVSGRNVVTSVGTTGSSSSRNNSTLQNVQRAAEALVLPDRKEVRASFNDGSALLQKPTPPRPPERGSSGRAGEGGRRQDQAGQRNADASAQSMGRMVTEPLDESLQRQWELQPESDPLEDSGPHYLQTPPPPQPPPQLPAHSTPLDLQSGRSPSHTASWHASPPLSPVAASLSHNTAPPARAPRVRRTLSHLLSAPSTDASTDKATDSTKARQPSVKASRRGDGRRSSGVWARRPQDSWQEQPTDEPRAALSEPLLSAVGRGTCIAPPRVPVRRAAAPLTGPGLGVAAMDPGWEDYRPPELALPSTATVAGRMAAVESEQQMMKTKARIAALEPALSRLEVNIKGPSV